MDLHLTDKELVVAIQRAAAPMSGYIMAELRQGRNRPPNRSTVLRRLQKLEGAGFIECTGGPKGYYGYTWRVTEAGRDLARSCA